MAPLAVRSCRNLLVVAASVTALAAARLPVHQAGPQPAHTGGFGEPACNACHFDYPLNDEPRAEIELDSLPGHFQPGESYTLLLRVQHPELKRGGFQLSARFEDGRNAGAFVLSDSSLLRVRRANDVDYLSHTALSSDMVEGSAIAWRITWTAPAEAQPVIFHLAVNVANADASEFGDRIFTTSATVEPQRAD